MTSKAKSSAYLGLTAAGIVGVSLALTVVGDSPVAAAPPATATREVLVVNKASAPVPTAAQGTTVVTGSVSVSSMPTVVIGATTTEKIVAKRYPASGQFSNSDVFDVSQYKSVRIGARLFCSGGCGGISSITVAEVTPIDGGFADYVLLATVRGTGGEVDLGDAYETPGALLQVKAVCDPGPCLGMDVVAFGRKH